MEKVCRIVFYGPLGAGKATCVESFRHLVKQTGAPRPDRPEGARSRRLDFIAAGLRLANGVPVRLVLSTASGGALPYVDRDLLKHADGVLFVADSRREAAGANVASMAKLIEDLEGHGRRAEAVPIVLLFNKRDVGDAVSVDEMAATLNACFAAPKPVFEARAIHHAGVAEALDVLARRILGLPGEIRWESTGSPEIPFRAVSSGKRLYVKRGDPPRSPLYTLIVDGESTETHDEWPSNWVLPRVRIGDPPAPRPLPAAAPAPTPAVARPGATQAPHGGEHEKSRAHFSLALAMAEATFGPEHPEVATALAGLGLALRDLGDAARARSLLERALAIDERSLGPEHPTVAVRLTNLGLLLRRLGDPIGALPLLERALEIREKRLGPEHPGTVRARMNLEDMWDA